MDMIVVCIDRVYFCVYFAIFMYIYSTGGARTQYGYSDDDALEVIDEDEGDQYEGLSYFLFLLSS